MKSSPVSLLALFVIFKCCFPCTASPEVPVDCEPVSDDGHFTSGATCRLVNDREESCNGPKRYKYDLSSCFGNDVGLGNLADESKITSCNPCSNQQSLSNATIDYNELNVSYNLTPFNFRNYNLTITLNFVTSSHLPVHGFGLKLIFERGPNAKYYICICEAEHTFTIEYDYNSPPYISLQVETFPYSLYPQKKLDLPSPTYCADCSNHIPYDTTTCGFPQFEKLPNIVLECNATHTNISWGVPYYVEPCTMIHVEVQLDTYYLTLVTCDGIINLTIQNATKITVNVSRNFQFFLYGHKPCSGLYQSHINDMHVAIACSKRAMCQDSSEESRGCCATSVPNCSPETSPIPSPSVSPTLIDPTPGNEDYLVAYITAGVGVSILIVTVTLVVLIFRLKVCKPSGKGQNLISDRSPSPFGSSALTIYSPSTAELEKRRIMQGFAEVRSFNTKIELQDTRMPKPSMADWLSECHDEASAVFCVCNREFKCDWENSGQQLQPTGGASLVQILRVLFQGDLASQNLEKYAVVLSKPADEVYIPNILRSLPRIDINDTSALAKFARGEN